MDRPRGSRALQVVGYLPEYRLQSLDPAVLGRVTEVVFFSISPLPDGSLDLSRFTPATRDRLRALRSGQDTPMRVCVGGCGRSDGFGSMTASRRARQRFVGELAALCDEHRFAGADFDWEFPGDDEAGGAYATLLAETAVTFEPLGLGVSAALGADPHSLTAVSGTVPRVHLMAYDQGTRHSTFENAQGAVERCLAGGVPRGALCLGLPFYGRSTEDTDVAMTYADIVHMHRPQPGDDEAGGMYFNGPETIRRKVRYALEQGLGGVMVWELGQDAHDDASLLRAIGQEVAEAHER